MAINSSKESTEEESKQTSSTNKQRFIKDFYESQKNNNNKNELLDDLFNKNEIPNNLINQFLSENSEGEAIIGINKYQGVSLNSIKLSELKITFLKDYITLKNNRDKIFSIINNEYDNLSTGNKDKIKKSLNNLEDKSILELFGNSKNRVNFIDSLFGNEGPIHKSSLSILRFDEFSKRADEIKDILEGDKKKDFLNILNRFDNGLITPIELKDLFSYGFFTPDEKKILIKTFLPSITLGDIKKYHILGDSDIKIKETELKDSYLTEIVSTFTDEEKKGLDLVKISNEIILDNNIQFFTDGKSFDISNSVLNKITENIDIEELDIENNLQKDKKEKNDKLGKSGDDFRKILKDLGMENTEDFKVGNIAQLNFSNKLDRNESLEKAFIEIVEIENGEVIFLDKGTDSFNPGGKQQRSYKFLDFKELFKGIKGKDTVITLNSITCFSKRDIDNKIISGEIDAEYKNIDYISQSNIDDKIKILNDEINDIDIKYANSELNKNDYDIIKDQLEKDLENEKKINYNKIKSEINRFDPDGEKFGLEEGTTFITKKGDIFTIKEYNLKENTFFLEGLYSTEIEVVDFNQFLDVFKQKETKRKSNTKTIEEVVSNAQILEGNWDKFEFKNDKIIKKETDNNIEYDYLVSRNSNSLIQINNYGNGYINVTFGEIKEDKIDKNKDLSDDNNKKTTFSTEQNSYNIQLSALDTLIKTLELVPRSLDEEKDIKEEDVKDESMKGNWITRFAGKTSIFDIISGGKIFIESIEGYLKEGNDEQAAKFASGVLGKILPEELRNDLQTREEGAKRKRMDEYKEKLGSVDSYVAVGMIENWLRNTDTADFKLEAAMIFMLEGYGTLYAKTGLYKLKGSYIWYKALGGKVGDELFNEYKAESEASDLPFNEDELVFKLMQRQCKANGYKGIKRRTRLHKEFKGLRGKGQEDEWEKGKKDAALSRNIEGRVDYGIGELGGGTYVNAMGSFESIVEKGAGNEIWTLNELPFVMIFSGDAYSYDEKLLDDFKNHVPSGRLVPMTALMSKKSHIDLQNETIMELCKDLGTIHNLPDMYSEAKTILGNQNSSKLKSKDKVENTRKFYKKYGELLTRSLYMLNTGVVDDFSKTDKLILYKMDKNPVYKRYYTLYSAVIGAQATYKNDDYVSDAFLGAGTTAMSLKNAMEENGGMDQVGGLREKKRGGIVWDEVRNEIEAISERKYHDNKNENRRIQEILLGDILKDYIGSLINLGTNQTILNQLNSPTSIYGKSLNKWGISMKELFQNKISAEDMFNGSINAKLILNKYINNILTNTGSISNDIFSTIDKIKNDTINFTKNVGDDEELIDNELEYEENLEE